MTLQNAINAYHVNLKSIRSKNPFTQFFLAWFWDYPIKPNRHSIPLQEAILMFSLTSACMALMVVVFQYGFFMMKAMAAVVFLYTGWHSLSKSTQTLWYALFYLIAGCIGLTQNIDISITLFGYHLEQGVYWFFIGLGITAIALRILNALVWETLQSILVTHIKKHGIEAIEFKDEVIDSALNTLEKNFAEPFTLSETC